jgi:thiol-disulfide isomerase/thioredoxin
MRTAAALTIIATAAIALAIPALPRKSPEFSIVEVTPQGQPGKTTLLSSYRGKVVVLAFVHTTCTHCQAFCQELTKLHVELGPKGFQPIAVAWNPQANLLVPAFVRDLRIDFPVGFASAYDPVMNFLGFSVMDRPVVPLIAVIDRKGMLRAQSPPQGDANLQEENSLRALITSLLNEPSGMTKK